MLDDNVIIHGGFSMSNIEEQIKYYRNKLLDLSFRNQLLNYRPTKRRSIGFIEDLDPSEIYQGLVIKKRKIQVKSEQFKNKERTETTRFSTDVDATDSETKSLVLYTKTEPDELSIKLLFLYKQSLTALEEQGYTLLYLALGFLEWYEPSNPAYPIKSPLILVPVEMTRERSRKIFRIIWTEEEIFTNITLKTKLSELGVVLPEFQFSENGGEISNYFNKIEENIQGIDGWKVIPNSSFLDLFSFTKFIMFNDLDPSRWPIEKNLFDHPLLNRIFNPELSKLQISSFNENEVDTRLTAIKTYHIRDADSSQVAVIEDVKAGRDLIVEGPPGTGKSQTITNIIAELLAAQKSILFVSEKMAALNVVKNRLDDVGLGDYCLPIHSHKTKKSEFINEIKKAVNQNPPNIQYDENAFHEIERLKKELNDYAISLSSPIGNRNITPHVMIGRREKLRKHFIENGKKIQSFEFIEPENFDEQEWRYSISRLIQLQQILPKIGKIATNPWKGTVAELVLPHDIDNLKGNLLACQNELNEFLSAIELLIANYGIGKINSLEDFKNSLNAIKLLQSSNRVDENILLNPGWNTPNENASILIDLVRNYHSYRQRFLKKLKKSVILRVDLSPLIKEYSTLSGSFLKIFNKRYKTLRTSIVSQYIQKSQVTDEEILQDLVFAQEIIHLRQTIKTHHDLGLSLFGSLWNDEESDPNSLEEFKNWIVSFRYELIREKLTEKAAEIVSKGIKPEELDLCLNIVESKSHLFTRSLGTILEILNADSTIIFGNPIEKIKFEDIRKKLIVWEQSISSLVYWSNFILYRKECQNSYGKFILPSIESDKIPPEDIIHCFEINYYDAMLRFAYQERLPLKSFNGNVFEDKIRRFQILDDKILHYNRQRLNQYLYQNLPDLSSGSSRDPQENILIKEFIKKKRHLPIRNLLTNAGELIQKIKPCFMMSPLSVAQYLDPRSMKPFDVVIFDEASQVRPEDALGSLLRGNHAVIMGDSRQLPPTAFFERMLSSDEEIDEELLDYAIDAESILNLAKTGFPTKTLRWHYRSRHESLIAVSNREFYDNKLMVYPSPKKFSQDLGLKLVYSPQTRYDRGRSRTNKEEAKIVAQHVITHFTNYPEKSLMVGTFSTAQQQVINDEIEKARDLHPELEYLFSRTDGEKFDVKNLETIQGDERDVVFVSIGYGFDELGRISTYFGPLNMDGGERRLNVLITRAREKCVIFSNFKANHIDLSKTSSFGVRVLQSFLHYAESGEFPVIGPYTDETESPFETEVYEFLKSKGFEVHPQVGCAGFRIDLGIIDPEIPGQYLIGIECDGAMYHSSHVARDRDKLRQYILQGLGWNLYRIWSTDWYRNPGEAEMALITAINNAMVESGI